MPLNPRTSKCVYPCAPFWRAESIPGRITSLGHLHPFRVIKRQFGFVKVRYRVLEKNTQQLFTLFALSNLWMVRGKLMQMQA